MKCAVQGCFAKAYTKIQPDLIIEVADGKKRPNGTTRKAFKVDYSNPRMRNLDSYDFYEKCSPNHNHPAQVEKGAKGLFTAVKKDLREQIGLLSVASGRSEVETVLRAMQLRAQYGCGAQSQIVGKKSNEHKSAHDKIARSRGYQSLDAYTVPPEFTEISFTNYENLGFPRSEKFYQGRTANCE